MFKKGNIIVFFLVLIIGLGVFYFISAPFQIKVDSAISQATKWTPENIQKDPVGYLTWAQSECDKILSQLGAREISVKSGKGESERELLEKEGDLKTLSALLAEAKPLYKKNSFPVSLRSIQLDEPQLKAKIIEAFQKIELINKAIPQYQNNIKSLEQKILEIQNKTNEVNSLRRKLTSDIELAKLQKENSNFGNILKDFNSLIDTSSALVKADGIPKVEDIAKMQSKEKADLDFEKIMGSN